MRARRQPVAPGRRQRIAATANGPVRPHGGERADRSFRAIIGDVQWTPAYIGLLLYIFTIITYRIPVGDIAMVIALAGVAFQRERFRFPPLLAWFAVFILWGAIGYLQSDYGATVAERLIDFGKLWLIALVMVNAVRTPGQARFFLIFFLACFATHPARGTIFNYLGGYTEFGRAAWNRSFGNPNDMAALTLLPLAIAAALLRDRSIWVRRGAIASIIVLPIVMLLTQSRGGVLALALFAALTLLGQRKKLRSAVLLLVVGGAAALLAPDGIWERMDTLVEQGSEADSSSQQRWLIWQVAGEIISDHPLTGVGLGAYPQKHDVYAMSLPREVRDFAGGARDTHSTYLNVIAETGYPGFLLFFAVLVAPLWVAERARRRLKRTAPHHAAQLWFLEAGLVAYLVAGVFGTFSHLSFLYIHLALLAVLPLQRLEESEQRQRLPHGRRGGTQAWRGGASRSPRAALRQPTG